MTDETSAALDELIADLAGERQDHAAGALPGQWPTMIGLGLAAVGVDEAAGGSGGTLLDAADLARALGRHAISSPLIEHATAHWALGAPGPATEELTVLAFADELGPGPFHGLLRGVPWARHARYLLLVARDRTTVIDLHAPGVTLQHFLNEAQEPHDTVTLHVANPAHPDLPPRLEALRNRLGLLRAAALTGAIDGAYRLTRRYVSEREQFGAPLVRIAGVATNLATIKAELIQVEAALERARDTAAQELDTDRCTAAIAVARVVAARAATTTARLSHQLHGAMGTTNEYPLHRYTTRLWAWRDEDHSEHEWSTLLGSLATTEGEETLWRTTTG
jgi:acyl-CoA dehydrogenase